MMKRSGIVFVLVLIALSVAVSAQSISCSGPGDDGNCPSGETCKYYASPGGYYCGNGGPSCDCEQDSNCGVGEECVPSAPGGCSQQGEEDGLCEDICGPSEEYCAQDDHDQSANCCNAPEFCETSGFTCVECEDDMDCLENEVCNEGNCEGPSEEPVENIEKCSFILYKASDYSATYKVKSFSILYMPWSTAVSQISFGLPSKPEHTFSAFSI